MGPSSGFDFSKGDAAHAAQRLDPSKLSPRIPDLGAEKNSVDWRQCQDSCGLVEEAMNLLKVNLITILLSHTRAILSPYLGGRVQGQAFEFSRVVQKAPVEDFHMKAV